MTGGLKSFVIGNFASIRARDGVTCVVKDARDVLGGGAWTSTLRLVLLFGDSGEKVVQVGEDSVAGLAPVAGMSSVLLALLCVCSSCGSSAGNNLGRFAEGEDRPALDEKDTGSGKVRFSWDLSGWESGITLGGVCQESDWERRCVAP